MQVVAALVRRAHLPVRADLVPAVVGRAQLPASVHPPVPLDLGQPVLADLLVEPPVPVEGAPQRTRSFSAAMAGISPSPGPPM